jgi:hypothetical protein
MRLVGAFSPPKIWSFIVLTADTERSYCANPEVDYMFAWKNVPGVPGVTTSTTTFPQFTYQHGVVKGMQAAALHIDSVRLSILGRLPKPLSFSSGHRRFAPKNPRRQTEDPGPSSYIASFTDEALFVAQSPDAQPIRHYLGRHTVLRAESISPSGESLNAPQVQIQGARLDMLPETLQFVGYRASCWDMNCPKRVTRLGPSGVIEEFDQTLGRAPHVFDIAQGDLPLVKNWKGRADRASYLLRDPATLPKNLITTSGFGPSFRIPSGTIDELRASSDGRFEPKDASVSLHQYIVDVNPPPAATTLSGGMQDVRRWQRRCIGAPKSSRGPCSIFQHFYVRFGSGGGSTMGSTASRMTLRLYPIKYKLQISLRIPRSTQLNQTVENSKLACAAEHVLQIGFRQLEASAVEVSLTLQQAFAPTFLNTGSLFILGKTDDGGNAMEIIIPPLRPFQTQTCIWSLPGSFGFEVSVVVRDNLSSQDRVCQTWFSTAPNFQGQTVRERVFVRAQQQSDLIAERLRATGVQLSDIQRRNPITAALLKSTNNTAVDEVLDQWLSEFQISTNQSQQNFFELSRRQAETEAATEALLNYTRQIKANYNASETVELLALIDDVLGDINDAIAVSTRLSNFFDKQLELFKNTLESTASALQIFGGIGSDLMF